MGGHAEPDEAGRRLAWTPCWYARATRRTTATPARSRGSAVVDLNTMEVLRVEEHGDLPLPPAPATTAPTASARSRDDIKPLEIAQPEGPSFDGRRARGALAEVALPRRLQRPRGADAAHDRATETTAASGRSCTAPRSPRWSCPTATRARHGSARTPSTSASTASGRCANSLELGCDCLGQIHYFDAHRPRQPRRRR